MVDDYVMVPREPTEEMVLNGVRAFQHAYSETDVLKDWKDCYRAMIAMAPIRTREWVGLTDDEVWKILWETQSAELDAHGDQGSRKQSLCTLAIQAKLKEKNGG